jgi:hypothetical protein
MNSAKSESTLCLLGAWQLIATTLFIICTINFVFCFCIFCKYKQSYLTKKKEPLSFTNNFAYIYSIYKIKRKRYL